MVRARVCGSAHQQWRDLQSRGSYGRIEDAADWLARQGDESGYREISRGANQRSRAVRARALARFVAWRGATHRADWKGRRQSAGDVGVGVGEQIGAELSDCLEPADRSEFAHRGLCLQPYRRRAEQPGRFVSAGSRIVFAKTHVGKTESASLSLRSQSQFQLS